MCFILIFHWIIKVASNDVWIYIYMCTSQNKPPELFTWCVYQAIVKCSNSKHSIIVKIEPILKPTFAESWHLTIEWRPYFLHPGWICCFFSFDSAHLCEKSACKIDFKTSNKRIPFRTISLYAIRVKITVVSFVTYIYFALNASCECAKINIINRLTQTHTKNEAMDANRLVKSIRLGELCYMLTFIQYFFLL